MNFYTNVQSIGGNILFRGIIDGKRVKQRIEYSPSLFLPSKRTTKFTNLEGEYLDQKIFGTIREAKDFIKQFEGVSNAPKIYGQDRFEYAYIADNYPDMVDFDANRVMVAFLDIEVGSEEGFPNPQEASQPITAIGIKYLNGDMFVFGCGDYEKKGKEHYIKCKDEWTLCKRFMELWTKRCPDIVTGWNTKFFDIPYIVNRFRKILGEDETKNLSPWKYIFERNDDQNKHQYYDFVGISSLDYLELYKWYAPGGKSQESYRLDNIAFVELGERKMSYDEYDSLHSLYRLNHQKFIEYNIRDVELIVKMEEKLKLVDMAMTLAYYTKSNFNDVFAQTRMWDALTYSRLLNENIIVPPRVLKEKVPFDGAYVKDPIAGLHEWVVSFDLDSLYPHLKMQYNISPEMLIEPEDYTQEMRDIISQGVTIEKMLKKSLDLSKIPEGVTITPNGQFFRTTKQGFLPKLLEGMYEDRKKFKKIMIAAKKEKESTTDPVKIAELENKIAKYNNLQLAMKVTLNSAYGATGSRYFRFYDPRMASGVTAAGQLSIRWIINKINEYMNNALKTDRDYVIASDTDSVYLNLGPLVHKFYPEKVDTDKVIAFMDRVCEQKIQPYLDKSYQELAVYVNAYSQKMRMKRENLADKGIWTAKKRYILNIYDSEGVRYKEPHLKITGMEMIKSSTPSAIREKMMDAVTIMVRGTQKELQDYISKFREEFNNLPAEEISFPRGCNGIEQYSDVQRLYKKGTPIQVKGAILYNHYLKQKNLDKKYPLIQDGEKIKFTYLKMPNPFKDTVVSYPGRLPIEFGLDKYIDYEVQFEKSFLDPIKVILDCMKWKIEEQDSIADFFL